MFKSRNLLFLSKRFLSSKQQIKNNEKIFENLGPHSNHQQVHVWGCNETGALGYNNIPCLCQPKHLEFFEKYNVITATCGFGFSAFAVEETEADIKSGHKVYGSGLNTDRQIGPNQDLIYTPQIIHFNSFKYSKINKLSAGRAHLAVLTDEGLVLMGNNSYGQCGNNQDNLNNEPIYIPNLDNQKIVDVECGQDHTLAITDNGSVYSCGWSADGQTGLGHYTSTNQFTKIKGDMESEKIIKITSRSDCVLALNDRGEVFGWGNTEYGQLPSINSDNTQFNLPIYISKLKICGTIRDIASGGAFCLALNNDGVVFSWGYGLLGVSPKVQQTLNPLEISSKLFGGNKIERITCGVSYMMAIASNGDLYAWGKNFENCLGLNSTKDQEIPQKVTINGFVRNVFCGFDHTIAICDKL